METEKRYKLHMDTLAFASKPGRDGLGSVKRLVPRVSHNIVEVTKEGFVQTLLSGVSVIPGLCAMEERKPYQGALQKDWVSQDFFALDFDDGKYSKEQVLSKFTELGIPVFFIHDTYSSSEAKEKFHVFFCAKETVVDRNTRDQFQAILMSIFADGVDRACANRNRYFNGTNKGAYHVNYDAEVNVCEVVERYWTGSDEQLSFLPKDSELLSKVKVPKARKESQKKAEREERGEVVYLLPDEEFFADSIPVVHHGLIKYNLQMKFGEYMNLVSWILENKVFTEGTGRRSLIFDVFNVASFAIGSREAYKLCLEINDRFTIPLSAKDLASCVVPPYEHEEEGKYWYLHETHYVYRYETLLDRMGIPKEMREGLSYYKNKRDRERAEKYRPLKEERNSYVAELIAMGYGYKKIHRLVNEQYGHDENLSLSLSGVRYLVKSIREGCSIEAVHLLPTPQNFSKEVGGESDASSVVESMNQGTLFIENEAPSLNKEQSGALLLAKEGRNVELIARAGTGKSYVLDFIRQALEAQGKRVGVCAATGLAAQAIGGYTVHSLFGIRPGEPYRLFESVIERLLTYDCIIIDEIGMVDSEVFTAVCKALYRMEFHYLHPIQLIIAGDALQLQPVKGDYYFDSPYYPNMELVKVNLTQNMRQSDAQFDELLNRLRRGDRGVVPKLNRLLSREEDRDALYIYARRAQAYAKNMEILNRLPGKLIRLDERLVIKIGAKVVVTANAKADADCHRRYFNGMRGTVTKVGKRVVVIETDEGKTVAIKRQEIHDEAGSYRGYPLQLGYALTIHKVQGMTLESANIHPGCFANGQFYTALSRVKTAGGIHLLAPIKEWGVLVNQKAADFAKDVRNQMAM